MKKTQKRRVFLVLFFLAVIGYVLSSKYTKEKEQKDTTATLTLQEKHAYHLKNSPFKDTKNLSRTDRKKLGLPPNAYNDQLWELTMNPALGRPTPENITRIQRELALELQERSPGDAGDNPWVERGPNNIGGRTRALLFDPNDVGNANPADDYTRVFAGSVSGGLWVNDDITDPNSAWQLVDGLADNISVTVLAADPNNSNILYLGSGESYTSGFGVGSGIYKSTDGGVTWNQIFGGNEGTSTPNGNFLLLDGIFYINDLVLRDNAGTTEIYIAAASGLYQQAREPFNHLGFDDRGLYKSDDGGTTWARFPIQYNDGTFRNPNDIEIDINNEIWLSTTDDFFGNPGGAIYHSTDGLTFNLEFTIPGADRTEIEPSSLTAGTFWVAANVNGQANLYTTTDGFTTISLLNEPNDADNGIPANDYARNQAFYNLPIEVDANDNLYVGGIDLFKYNPGTDDWDQLSKWAFGNGLQTITASFVHADQHAIVFRPNNGTAAVIGNDGGVYYTDDLLNAANTDNVINPRNNNYNVTQFYYGSIAETDIADGDDYAGGTQDNGSLATIDANPGINAVAEFLGGDGAYTEINAAKGYIIASFPFMNHAFLPYPTLTTTGAYFVASETNPNSFREGSFINVAELDKNFDILYTNASTSTGSFRIGKFENVDNGPGSIVRTDLTNGLLNSTPTAFKISSDGQTLYAGLQNGRLLRIGAVRTTIPIWSNVSDGNFVGSISDIEFGENENEILVTFHNYGVTSVWFSPDQGVTWEEKEGNLPDFPVKSILMNPLVANGAEVIIGTDLGVWKTQDFNTASPTWVQSQNGMRSVSVIDMDLRTSDNTVLATTHGRGFFTGSFLAGALSTEEFTKGNNFSIYPTISNGNMTLNANNSGTTTVETYTLAGQRVDMQQLELFKNTRTNFDLTGLSSGIYILKIQQGERLKTQKIVIE